MLANNVKAFVKSRPWLYALARRARGDQPVLLDYPVHPRPRWGHGTPPHPRLSARLQAGRAEYGAVLDTILRYADGLARIPAHASGAASEPRWINGYLPGLDAAALYALLASTNPARYVEIGSGNSTRFARQAIRDHGLRTRITSIDPHARVSVEGVADEQVPRALEDLDPDWFSALQPGDVLFLDGSHRCLPNSDVTAFFLDVLPRLVPGILVHVHDVHLPYDHPPEWMDKYYTEQYVLAAFLLAADPGFDVVFPAYFVSRDPELGTALDGLWNRPGLQEVERHGVSFWFRTR